MWTTFLLCCVALLILLYAPGAVISRAVGLSAFEVAVLAPLVSVFLCAVLGIFLDLAGLKGTYPVLCGILAVTLLFALMLFARAGGRSGFKQWRINRECAIEVAISVLVCIVSMIFLFVRAIGDPSSFLEFADNAFHLNVIKAMVDGGSLSVFHVTQYSAMPSADQAPYSIDGAFYPAGWHILVAMVCSATGAPVSVGENAGAMVFAGFVFPVGMSLLLKSIFPGRRGIAAIGSLAFCACAAFPFAPLVVHQIYPNFAALCSLPGLIAFFAMRINGACGVSDMVKAIALLLVPLFGCAILHPNAVIAFFVMAVSLLVLYPWGRLVADGKFHVAVRALIPLATVAVFACGWFFLMDAAIFSSVTSFLWEWTVSPADAFIKAVSFGFVLGIPQVPFAIFVAVGFVVCARDSRSRWLCLALVAFLAIFFFNACGDPGIKRLFAGYWYTDAERTAAVAALAAVPCASVGLYSLVECVQRRTLCIVDARKHGFVFSAAMSCIAMVLFCAVSYMTYFPFSENPTAIGFRRYELHYASAADCKSFFTKDEIEFCDKVKGIVGDDLVLNMPQDGSLFAYSICDLNVYYKSYVADDDSASSQLVRGRLSACKDDETAKNAVEATNSRFVMLLDRGDEAKANSALWGDFSDLGWEGFKNLDGNDSFRLVLEDGARKLYEIV